MKRLKKWLARMMGGGKRQRRYVMVVSRDQMLEDVDAYAAFLLKHTPVIGAKDYNALPSDVKKLFVKVGAK